jgi:hypothetical protein
VNVKEGVNKSNHPIQNPLLFVTKPRTLENINKSTENSVEKKQGIPLEQFIAKRDMR